MQSVLHFRAKYNPQCCRAPGRGSSCARFRSQINIRCSNQAKRVIVHTQPEYRFAHSIQKKYFSRIVLMDALNAQYQSLQWNAARPQLLGCRPSSWDLKSEINANQPESNSSK